MTEENTNILKKKKNTICSFLVCSSGVGDMPKCVLNRITVNMNDTHKIIQLGDNIAIHIAWFKRFLWFHFL